MLKMVPKRKTMDDEVNRIEMRIGCIIRFLGRFSLISFMVRDLINKRESCFHENFV